MAETKRSWLRADHQRAMRAYFEAITAAKPDQVRRDEAAHALAAAALQLHLYDQGFGEGRRERAKARRGAR